MTTTENLGPDPRELVKGDFAFPFSHQFKVPAKMTKGGCTFDIEKNASAFSTGMTLRDWFASVAWHATLCENAADEVSATKEELAQHAYDHADAMLAARKT